MAVGEIHTFPDGYSFQETLHGPMAWGVCVDCGVPALEALCNRGQIIKGVPPTRCGRCGRRHFGLDMA